VERASVGYSITDWSSDRLLAIGAVVQVVVVPLRVAADLALPQDWLHPSGGGGVASSARGKLSNASQEARTIRLTRVAPLHTSVEPSPPVSSYSIVPADSRIW
jgi:hypothetical protein